MTAILATQAASETYTDVEKLIYHICNKFAAKHGGDIDDLISLANQVWCDCYAGWKSGSAPFSSYLSTCIWRRLLGAKRRAMRLPTVSTTGADGEMILESRKSSNFQMSEFVSELSQDGRTIISLIFETPAELATEIAQKGGHTRNIRKAVKDYLKTIGWTCGRIAESFEEIGAVLS